MITTGFWVAEQKAHTAGERFGGTLCENAPHCEIAGRLYEVVEAAGSVDYSMYLDFLSTNYIEHEVALHDEDAVAIFTKL